MLNDELQNRMCLYVIHCIKSAAQERLRLLSKRILGTTHQIYFSSSTIRKKSLPRLPIEMIEKILAFFYSHIREESRLLIFARDIYDSVSRWLPHMAIIPSLCSTVNLPTSVKREGLMQAINHENMDFEVIDMADQRTTRDGLLLARYPHLRLCKDIQLACFSTKLLPSLIELGSLRSLSDLTITTPRDFDHKRTLNSLYLLSELPRLETLGLLFAGRLDTDLANGRGVQYQRVLSQSLRSIELGLYYETREYTQIILPLFARCKIESICIPAFSDIGNLHTSFPNLKELELYTHVSI